ncbi:toxin-antitoxin system YwqK family antitoxin [Maridesulfovibrio zosterae]|uniref:toxin-antitoxin system YwqK family antitoxin n=1 Tax=Maridesulfovibrio zosterae TaxID=82171 RepID=UPI00042A0EDD|nr:toxin-antitoxin system YwqK family antitoxin [Maridesulfovibrio zosterae]
MNEDNDYVQRDDQGNILFRVPLKDGKPHGTGHMFNSEGRIVQQMEYQHGVVEGEVRRFDEDGHLVQVSNMQNGKLNGELRTFEHQRPHILMNYVNNEPNGIMQVWHPNGQLAAKTTLLHGKQEGESLVYGEQGELMQRLNYQNGMLHGSAEQLFSSGTIREKTHWVEGLKHGESLTFSESGELERQVQYEKGNVLSQKLIDELSTKKKSWHQAIFGGK